MVPVSVVVITRNEERNIERCLKSVAWAAEMIVVDAHSEDRTREMALALRARVIECDWSGYASQKNFGVQATTQPWVLNVDADEQVTPALATQIAEVVSRDDHMAYRVLIPTYFMGRPLKHYGRASRDPGHVRLFRKDSARFGTRVVHEVVEVEGSIGWLTAPILHFSYPTIETYWKKIHAYAALEARERIRSPKRGTRWLRALGKLGWMMIWRGGLLDGPAAWIWIVGQAYEEWLTTAQAVRLQQDSRKQQAPRPT